MSRVGAAADPGHAQRPAMDAADPAGGEDPDAGGVRRDHRGRHGRRGPAAVGERRPRGSVGRPCGPIPAGAVASASRAAVVEPDQEPAVVDRDRRRDVAPASPDRGLGRPRDLEVLRDTAGRG